MGLGTSTGTSSTTSPWAGPLGSFGTFETKLARPLLNTLGSQFLEALRTGGVNSFIPWITRAVDASRSAASTSNEELQQRLARSGFDRTSAGAAIAGNQAFAGNQNVAATPEEMIMNFIQGAPSFATSLASGGTSALSAAGGLQNTRRTSQTPSFWDQFNQGVQSGGVLAAGFNPPTSNIYNFGTV